MIAILKKHNLDYFSAVFTSKTLSLQYSQNILAEPIN